jgi:hypothetical protein
MLRLAPAALMLAACADPSFEVRFDMPADWREAVVETSLSVYAPADTGGIRCDDIALGTVDAETLAAARVAEVLARRGDRADLDDVPREGPKRFVARGFDDMGRERFAGCAEHDLIEDGDTVTIPAERRIQLAVPGLRTTLDALPDMVEVQVSDALGEIAPGVTVGWALRTMDGPGDISELVSNERGRALLDLPPPPRPGPLAVDVHARWQINPLPPVSAFGSPSIADSFTFTVGAATLKTPNDQLYRVGRIGPAGEPGYAVLAPLELVGAWAIHLRYRGDDGVWRGASAPSINTRAIALVPRGGRDMVVTVAGGRWVDIDPISGATRDLGVAAGGVFASRLLSVGGCEPNAPLLLQLVRGDDSAQVVDADFAAVPMANVPKWLELFHAEDRIVASGCVADTSGAAHRTTAVVRNRRVMVLSDIDGKREGAWPVTLRGIGFARGDEDERPRLLGTELTIDGAQITRTELVSLGATLTFAPIGSDDIASAAIAVTGGRVNDDAADDLAALIVTGGSEVRLFLSVTQEPGYGNLRGLSCEKDLADPRLFVFDSDGDGQGEVLLAGLGNATVLDLQTPGSACASVAGP